MTSCYPYTQSRNLTFMFDLPDLQGKRKIEANENTVLDYILKNKDKFSIFLKLLEISNLHSLFNHPQFNKTVFIPQDSSLENYKKDLLSLDKLSAGNIIKYSTLQGLFPSRILSSSPSSLYTSTYSSSQKIKIVNFNNKTIINDCASVIIPDIQLTNGILHVIDNILTPEVYM